MGKERSLKKLKIITIVLAILLVLSLVGLAVNFVLLHMREAESTDTVSGNIVYQDPQGVETGNTQAQNNISTENSSGQVGIELYKGANTDNQPFDARGMVPGDRVSQRFAVQVYHQQQTTVDFTCKITEETKNLGDVLMVQVVSEDGTTLFDGPFHELEDVEVRTPLPATSDGSSVLTYQITAYLDTSVGNEYTDATLKADFIWSVPNDEVTEPPFTGDKMNLMFLLIAAISAAGIIIVVSLSRRKGGAKA